MSKKAPAVQGRRFEAVRWSVGQAAYEFGLDHRTLTKRLTRSSIEPGDDGRYSTQQITSVVWGDRESEELRKITEDADHMALKNRKERGDLVDIKVVFAHFEGVFVALRQHILSCKIPREDQDAMLRDLKRLTIEYHKGKLTADADGAAGDDTESAASD